MAHQDYSRVQTRLKAHVRPAASADALPMAYDHPALQGAGERPDLAAAGMSQVVSDFLLSVDAKLDTVISLLNQKRLEEEFAASLEIIEIGGDGVRLADSGDFKSGDALELAIILNQFPLRIASAVGVLETADGGTGVPVAFSRIREPDLEAVVAFVFQEQRAHIRETRWAD